MFSSCLHLFGFDLRVRFPGIPVPHRRGQLFFSRLAYVDGPELRLNPFPSRSLQSGREASCIFEYNDFLEIIEMVFYNVDYGRAFPNSREGAVALGRKDERLVTTWYIRLRDRQVLPTSCITGSIDE